MAKHPEGQASLDAEIVLDPVVEVQNATFKKDLWIFKDFLKTPHASLDPKKSYGISLTDVFSYVELGKKVAASIRYYASSPESLQEIKVTEFVKSYLSIIRSVTDKDLNMGNLSAFLDDAGIEWFISENKKELLLHIKERTGEIKTALSSFYADTHRRNAEGIVISPFYAANREDAIMKAKAYIYDLTELSKKINAVD